MLKTFPLVLALLAAAALPALAEPPADLDACIKLSNQIAKDAGAKITTEAEFPKYHSRMLELDFACGQRDFAGAEKIANDIKATYHLDR